MNTKRLLAALLALCLCAGCAAAETTIAYWGGEEAQAAMTAALDKYNRKTVRASSIAYGSREEYARALPTQAADVLMIDPALLDELTKDGAPPLVNMEDYAGVVALDNFGYLALCSLTADGVLYGVPISGGARLLLWNGAAAESELELAQRAALCQGDGVIAVDAPGCALMIIARLQSQHGRDWLDEKGQVQFSALETAQACRWLQGLIEQRAVVPTADPLALWSAGRCEAVWVDCADAPAYEAAAPEGASVTLRSHVESGLPFEGDMQWAACGFAISKSSANAPQAAALIEYLLNSEKGMRSLGDALGTPMSEDGYIIANRYRLLDPALTDAAREALSWGRYVLPRGFSARESACERLTDALLSGRSGQAAEILLKAWTEE